MERHNGIVSPVAPRGTDPELDPAGVVAKVSPLLGKLNIQRDVTEPGVTRKTLLAPGG